MAAGTASDEYGGRKLRFGIIGCGAIGPTHAGAIGQIEDAELVAVADVVGERARKLADKSGGPRVYDNADALLADAEVDIVCVCTPSGLHGDIAVAALGAGKHVVVEKPMEVSLEKCDRMIAAQRRSGKILSVISQHRFDDASILVKQLIDAGKLGEIFLITADVKWWRTQAYYDSGEWRGTWAMDGGGALMNQGIHTVDVVQWLAGGVSSVFAQTRTAAHERIEVEDVAVATLRFTNGAVGSMVASTAAWEGLPVRIDVFGTGGTAIIEGDRLKLLILKDGETYRGEAAASHAMSVARGGTASVKEDASYREASADPGAVWGDAHREQLRDVIRAIRSNTAPLIDGVDGRKPVQIIRAVYESAASGKPVTLGSGDTARE